VSLSLSNNLQLSCRWGEEFLPLPNSRCNVPAIGALEIKQFSIFTHGRAQQNRPHCSETRARVLQARRETQATRHRPVPCHRTQPCCVALQKPHCWDTASGLVGGFAFRGELYLSLPCSWSPAILRAAKYRGSKAKESVSFPLQMACLTDTWLLSEGGIITLFVWP